MYCLLLLNIRIYSGSHVLLGTGPFATLTCINSKYRDSCRPDSGVLAIIKYATITVRASVNAPEKIHVNYN